MKDLSKFEEYGRSLAERVAQGKFNKEKVEKTIRSKAKKATNFQPYQNYYSEYALKAFNERLSEIRREPRAAEKWVVDEVRRYFPEGLSNESNSNRGRMAEAQPGSEPPMTESRLKVLPDDEPGFEYSDIETDTQSYTSPPQPISTGVSPSKGGPFPTVTHIVHPGGHWTFIKKTIGGETFTGYKWADVDAEARAKGWEFYKSSATGETRARRRIAR